MTSSQHASPTGGRLLALTAVTCAACLALGGCSSLDGLFGTKVDYRSQAAKAAPLDVPPDLTQLAREGRFQAASGSVTASGQASRSTAVTTAQVAPNAVGDIRVERQGSQRWLSVPLPPEQVWPVVKAFWTERGFAFEVENAQTGVLETAWTENRTKIPQDFIRRTIGRVFDALYSSGERDRFRTRLERTATGTEVYISHRAMEEVYTSVQKDGTTWRAKPADPQVEAEMLSALMIRLGARDEVARETVAKVPVAPAPSKPAAAAVTGAAVPVSLVIDEEFDRAWRRVGVALDRSGFSVEDRDRAAGLFFVRYVDPDLAGREEPSFLARWFGKGEQTALQRLRVQLKSDAGKTTVTVQNAQGAPETGEAARRIVEQLSAGLR
ncbi:MAG: outer membrane protein assembly factor BamC [Rubrivivax sp.]